MTGRTIIERIPGPLAPLYEKATRMVIKTYYGPVAEEVLSHLNEGRILDLGTGPGYLPIEIVKRSSRIRVDGIDLSRALIRMARKNALKAGLADRLDFQWGNAASLRFKDDSYDMIISTGMLHMVKDPVKVLRECCRVLKSGGEAWIYDPAQVSSRIDVEAWKASFTPLETVLYAVFKVYTRISPGHTYRKDEVLALIEKTDFSACRIRQEGNEIKVKLKK